MQLEQAASEAGIACRTLSTLTASIRRLRLKPNANCCRRWAGTTIGGRRASPVPAVKVFIGGKRLALPVDGEGDFSWQFRQESGSEQQGRVNGSMTLALPETIAAGYHR